MFSLKRIYKAIILTSVAIAAQTTALATEVSAKGFWDQKKALTQRTPVLQHSSLIRLKKSDELWKVLEDSEIKALMKQTMGSDTEKYFNVSQLIEMPNVDKDELYAAGNVRGLAGIMESFFDLNMASKKLCICVLDDGQLSIYGAADHEALPAAVREYIKDLQGRMDRRPKIVFAKANTNVALTAQESKQAQPKKHMNVAVVTGSYKRVDCDPRFNGADLKVVRLPGGKINFSCQAIDGAHTGEASGVVPISKSNIAVYKQDEGADMTYKLIMHFDGKYVHVAQVGDGFGGIGVTATGTYEKMDDHKPEILQN